MMNAIFDIAGSAMAAQSVRLNTVASNLANAQSAASSVDQVYRARMPVFSAIQQEAMQAQAGFPDWMGDSDPSQAGVKVDGIVESDAPLERRYEPAHPLADDDGYVWYPNVNVVEQMTDMISASRSFQVNVDLLQTAKTMSQRLLTLGQ